MIKGLISAFRTLTIIPIPIKTEDNFKTAVVWFPIVGLVLGAILFFIAKLQIMLKLNHIFISFFFVFFSALLTRGIHLDGLADFADGFFGGYTKEKILKIMKDSNIGTFGALALMFVVFFKWICFDKLLVDGNLNFTVLAYILSRFSMSMLSYALPYARNNAGTAKPFVEGVTILHAALPFIFAFLLSILIFKLAGVVLFLLALVITAILGYYFYFKIDGVTGDLLGATCEIIEVSVLFFATFNINGLLLWVNL